MLGYSVVNQKGQVTVPATIRKALNIQPEDKVVLTRVGDGVFIKPAKPITMLRGSITPKSKPEDYKKMRRTFVDYLSQRKK